MEIWIEADAAAVGGAEENYWRSVGVIRTAEDVESSGMSDSCILLDEQVGTYSNSPP